MRYRIFVTCLILFMILMLGLSADLALAEAAPFQPDQAIYSLQLLAEQSLVKLNPDPGSRADFALDLLTRRITDLKNASGAAAEIPALSRLDQALDETAQELAPVLPPHATALRQRSILLLNDLQYVIASLAVAPKKDATTYGRVQLKATSFLIILSDPSRPLSALLTQLNATGTPVPQEAPTPTRDPIATATIVPPANVDPHIVAFQPGSGGAEHAFWPLTGAHQSLDCQTCHTPGPVRRHPHPVRRLPHQGRAGIKAPFPCHVRDVPQHGRLEAGLLQP